MFKTSFSIIVTLFCGLSPLSANEKNDQKEPTLHWKWAIESLEKFPFNEGDKVLDIRCGNGSITVEIAYKVPSGLVIGLDVSEDMLAYARDHHSVSNVIYMQGDARQLPFIEQFDKAVALLALNRISEHEQAQALHSLYTALKPGGKAIITRPGKQPSNLGPVAQALVNTDRWAPHFPDFKQTKHYYNTAEYTLLLEKAGFIVEKISEDSTFTYFKDRKVLLEFFRPLCNFSEHLPPELQQQFVEEIVDLVLTFDQPQSVGSIFLHDFKLEAVVAKPMR
jgi:trans-aconitate 2-methyltransferase